MYTSCGRSYIASSTSNFHELSFERGHLDDYSGQRLKNASGYSFLIRRSVASLGLFHRILSQSYRVIRFVWWCRIYYSYINSPDVADFIPGPFYLIIKTSWRGPWGDLILHHLFVCNELHGREIVRDLRNLTTNPWDTELEFLSTCVFCR